MAASALLLLALHYEMPNAAARYRERMWIECSPGMIVTQIPLSSETLWEALAHLRARGLITLREFSIKVEEQALAEKELMCAFTAKAIRALAPKTWADEYGWTKKEEKVA